MLYSSCGLSGRRTQEYRDRLRGRTTEWPLLAGQGSSAFGRC